MEEAMTTSKIKKKNAELERDEEEIELIKMNDLVNAEGF